MDPLEFNITDALKALGEVNPDPSASIEELTTISLRLPAQCAESVDTSWMDAVDMTAMSGWQPGDIEPVKTAESKARGTSDVAQRALGDSKMVPIPGRQVLSKGVAKGMINSTDQVKETVFVSSEALENINQLAKLLPQSIPGKIKKLTPYQREAMRAALPQMPHLKMSDYKDSKEKENAHNINTQRGQINNALKQSEIRDKEKIERKEKFAAVSARMVEGRQSLKKGFKSIPSFAALLTALSKKGKGDISQMPEPTARKWTSAVLRSVVNAVNSVSNKESSMLLAGHRAETKAAFDFQSDSAKVVKKVIDEIGAAEIKSDKKACVLFTKLHLERFKNEEFKNAFDELLQAPELREQARFVKYYFAKLAEAANPMGAKPIEELEGHPAKNEMRLATGSAFNEKCELYLAPIFDQIKQLLETK